MLRNYILIAWRSLLKNKLFSFINIFGLALSMSVCMIVLVRLMDALEYDTFHDHSTSVYRIVTKLTNPQGDSWTLASSPLPLKQTLLADNVKAGITRFYPAIGAVAKDQSREFSVKGVFIERSFFDVFGFTCRYGNAAKALESPYRLLLSQALAEKFYGKLDPTGRTLTLGELGEFEIAGVINTPPAKSHINYDVYVSMATVDILENNGLLPKKLNSWDSFEQGYTYIRLENQAARRSLEDKLDRISAEVTKNSQETGHHDNNNGSCRFELQSLDNITPGRSDIYNDIGRGPSRGSLMAEAGIVFIILLAACFNYTNLSVARALTRGKEVGIRKLSGAQRWQIFIQYAIEAIIIALLALGLANVILGLILEFKPFNDGYEMVPAVVVGARLMLVFVCFAIIAGLLAGAIPAWILSSFRPARILRGVGTEKLVGALSFRKVLTVLQFSLSLIILIFLTTFYNQFDFLAKADPGFHRKDIALIPAGEHPGTTATAFERLHGIKRTGFTSGRFGNGESVKASLLNSDEAGVVAEQYTCDREWIDMMHLNIIAGTGFADGSSDAMINEKATLAFGFKSIEEAVGSTIYVKDSTRITIKGVVKDFYTQGYGNAIKPVILREGRSALAYIAIETVPGYADARATLELEWKKQNPGHSFEPYWLDAEMNRENDQTAQISLLAFLGFMTVTIATLGLLGLVVYTVETRRKEISIRKIVGASVHQVITLLSRGFAKLLIISGLIALPVGYILSNLFLRNFANHIHIGIQELTICFSFLLSIGLVTILSQTWKASLENPSQNLKSE